MPPPKVRILGRRQESHLDSRTHSAFRRSEDFISCISACDVLCKRNLAHEPGAFKKTACWGGLWAYSKTGILAFPIPAPIKKRNVLSKPSLLRIPSLEMVTPGHTQHTHPLVLWEIEQDEMHFVSGTESFRPSAGMNASPKGQDPGAARKKPS